MTLYSSWGESERQRRKRAKWQEIARWLICVGAGYMVLGVPFLNSPKPYVLIGAVLFFSGLAEFVVGEFICSLTE